MSIASLVEHRLPRLVYTPERGAGFAVDHAEHIAAGVETDSARLQRQIDLREHIAALKIPDANSLVEIRNRDAPAGGIQGDQRRRTGNIEAALHVTCLQ